LYVLGLKQESTTVVSIKEQYSIFWN